MENHHFVGFIVNFGDALPWTLRHLHDQRIFAHNEFMLGELLVQLHHINDLHPKPAMDILIQPALEPICSGIYREWLGPVERFHFKGRGLASLCQVRSTLLFNAQEAKGS